MFKIRLLLIDPGHQCESYNYSFLLDFFCRRLHSYTPMLPFSKQSQDSQPWNSASISLNASSRNSFSLGTTSPDTDRTEVRSEMDSRGMHYAATEKLSASQRLTNRSITL